MIRFFDSKESKSCALHEGSKEEHMCPDVGVTNPTEPHHEFPEIEIQKLSTIVVNNDEFLFLWGIEKLFGLRLDECLDVIARTSTLKVDDSGDRLSDLLIHNGLLEDNVVIVQETIMNNENAQVPEAVFENPTPIKGLEELLERTFPVDEA
jgi:hypothetical protein